MRKFFLLSCCDRMLQFLFCFVFIWQQHAQVLVNHSCNFDVTISFILLFSWDIRNVNCACLLGFIKCGISVSIALSNSSIFIENTFCEKVDFVFYFRGTKRTKTLFSGYFGAFISPFSIIRPWSENLTFVNVTLYFLSLISER